MRKNIVVLTGAGISAESGLPTFRDSDGLWNNYNVDDVATLNGYNKNKEFVLDFYNDLRKKLKDVEPNEAHIKLAELEQHHNVHILTTNVDDLHERAGSTNILHLHGELTKSRSEANAGIAYEIGYNDIKLGDVDSEGSQMRPFVIWFGEMVPNVVLAAEAVEKADIFMIIGTSLEVYPVANLLTAGPTFLEKYIINPNIKKYHHLKNTHYFTEKATIGVPRIIDKIIEINK